MHLVVEFINLIGATFAFIYGAHVSFRKNGVLFLQIITCAFGCFLLGGLYNLCYFVCMGRSANGFNIGDLGYVGGMFFIFSSYFGAMDRIADGKDANLKKYRVISLIAPFFNIFIYLFFVFKNNFLNFNISFFIMSLLISAISYFSLKHLILPDIKDGILKSMRLYNFGICVLRVVWNLYNVLYLYNLESIIIFLKILIGIMFIVLMPFACKGVKKWST